MLEEIRDDGFPAWQAAVDKFSAFDAYCRVTQTEGDVGKPPESRSFDWHVVYDDSRNVTLLRKYIPEQPDFVKHQVANHRYHFRIYAENASERGRLAEVALLASSEGEEPQLPNFNEVFSEAMIACGSRDSTYKSILFNNKCKVIAAGEDFVNDKRIIWVNTESIPNVAEPENRQKATYWFEPQENYRCVRIAWDFEAPAYTYETTVTYHSAPYDHWPHEVVSVAKSSDYLGTSNHTWETPKSITVSDSEFYLPHYGFSEDVLQAYEPAPWSRWWLFILGIASLFVGWRIVRRNSQTRS